jgi:hypothetical protein
MQIWSHAFLEEAGTTCIIEEELWREVQEDVDAKRIFVEIRIGGQNAFCAVGSPIPRQSESEPRIFVPQSMLERLGVEGMGEVAEVTWRSEEAFPEATRIVLKPRDETFFSTNIKEELERALTRIGVLRVGDLIRFPLEALNGYEVEFDVRLTEPASIVLMQGDEVAIEFEQELPMRVPEPEPEVFEDGPVVPVTSVLGRALGGSSRVSADGRPWNPWREQ